MRSYEFNGRLLIILHIYYRLYLYMLKDTATLQKRNGKNTELVKTQVSKTTLLNTNLSIWISVNSQYRSRSRGHISLPIQNRKKKIHPSWIQWFIPNYSFIFSQDWGVFWWWRRLGPPSAAWLGCQQIGTQPAFLPASAPVEERRPTWRLWEAGSGPDPESDSWAS